MCRIKRRSFPRFKLPIKSDQRDPLALVLLLPDQIAVQFAGDLFGLQIVVQAEVALVHRFAFLPQCEERRMRIVLGAEDQSRRILLRLLRGAGDLRRR